MHLKESVTHYKQKVEIIIFFYYTTNFLETWFSFALHTKKQKGDKGEFVTKSIGMKVKFTVI